MVTIRDVAKLAGVSVATVSRVLNNHENISDKAKHKVLQAVAELHYQPNANAQALASQSDDTIGVVVTDVTDTFFAILVKSVDQVAEKYQKSILIGMGYHNADKERRAIDNLLRKRCTCLVVHAKALSDEELADYLQMVKGMVIINRIIPGFEHRCIGLDNTKGTEIATETLIRYGHRCIGYIGSNHPIHDETDRLQGYLNMLHKYRLPVRKLAITQASPTFEGGEEAMINLLSYNSDLTAVVAYNDSMASGAMSVLSENGIIVPKDFSIIGFDDMPIANHLIPKLTTIRYPIDLMANYAAELALSLANDDLNLPKPIQFNPTLVRRFSVERRQK